MRWLVVLGMLAFAASAAAGPTATATPTPARRKVLVLPLDGNAEVTVRAKLNAMVHKLAKTIDATVSTGDTTFDETAAALGCGPSDPACAESVRTTLGVDEVVYGSALSANGTTTVTVRRSASGASPRESTTNLSTQDPPDRAESAMLGLFTPATGSDVIDPVAPDPGPEPFAGDHHQRNIGVALTTGGGVVFIIGLALWSSAASTQTLVDNHKLENANDVADLKALETRTLEYAVLGDLLVLAGLAAGGYGAWVLYKDHNAHQVIVTSMAMDHGGGVSIRGAW